MDFNSMKVSSQPSKLFSLFDSVHRRVHSYALMAMFAVGFLTLARPAQAEVVYTPTNVTIKRGLYGLDLNNDGVIDVTIVVGYEQGQCRGGGYGFVFFAEEIPAAGNGAEGAPPAALEKGEPVGPSQTYYAQVGTLKSYSSCTGRSSGEFGSQERYLGLRFRINGKTHYGWARLNLTVALQRVYVTVTGYAYETTPGEVINAGQTSGTTSEMDEDSSGGAYLTNPIPDAVQPVSLRALVVLDRVSCVGGRNPLGAASYTVSTTRRSAAHRRKTPVSLPPTGTGFRALPVSCNQRFRPLLSGQPVLRFASSYSR